MKRKSWKFSPVVDPKFAISLRNRQWVNRFFSSPGLFFHRALTLSHTITWNLNHPITSVPLKPRIKSTPKLLPLSFPHRKSITFYRRSCQRKFNIALQQTNRIRKERKTKGIKVKRFLPRALFFPKDESRSQRFRSSSTSKEISNLK